MALLSGAGILITGLAGFMTVFAQISRQKPTLDGIPTGKTRVIDLSYAINDKLVPWPGDEKWFEARDNATHGKERVLHAELLDAGALRHASGCAGAFRG